MPLCELQCELLYFQVPRTEDQWKAVAEHFWCRCNFPQCIGVVDGHHIAIRKPADDCESYINHEKSHSIVLMAIVGANGEFLIVDAGAKGQVTHHLDILQRMMQRAAPPPSSSSLPGTHLSSPYVLIGNDAFPLTEYLVKPFSGSSLTVQQQAFNDRIFQAQHVADSAFGVLLHRFHILRTEVNLAPEKAAMVCMACCYLHNFLLREVPNYALARTSSVVDCSAMGELHQQRPSCQPLASSLQQTSVCETSAAAENVRDIFCRYFNSDATSYSGQ